MISGGHDVWQECSANEKKPSKHMLTFPKHRYQGFANKLRQLREKCEEEVDYKDGFDSILEELYTKPELVEEIMTHNHTVDQFFDVLKLMAPRYMRLVQKYYHLDGTARTKDKKDDDNHWKSDSRFWTDPLVTPLPNVTKLKIYCSKNRPNNSIFFYSLYSSVWLYQRSDDRMVITRLILSSIDYSCFFFFLFSGYSYGFYSHTDYCSSALLLFNTSHTNSTADLKSGVYLGPGDATVPLVSLGHMCAGPWKHTESFHNPGHVKTIIREYIHKTTTFDILTTRLEDALRGGEYAVTHVEILGNRDFLTDLLMIVSKPIAGVKDHPSILNDSDVNQDQIYSNIRDISQRIMKRSENRTKSE